MYKLCIITPCSRFENLDTMYETVKHPSVLWIIVHDSLNHTLKEYIKNNLLLSKVNELRENMLTQ